MKSKNTLTIVAVVLIIVAAVGGFFVGMQYQKSQTGAAFRQFGGGNFAGGANSGNGTFVRRGANGGTQTFTPVRGQILSLGSGTMTVKEQDGSTKIVVLGSNTTFVQSQTASLSDLKQGDTVMVVGNQNSDGSVTATDVQINPQGLGRPSGGTGTAPAQ